MTPPRTPDHDSDDIVDMTPVFTEDEDTQESVESAPAYQPEGRSEEFEDVTPEIASGENAPESVARAPHPQASRPEKRAAKAPAHMPEPEPAVQDPVENRPDAHRSNRRKPLLMILVGLAVVALVGKVFGASIGSGAITLLNGNKAPNAASPSVATPTPNTVLVGNKPITATPGPLILLNPGVVRQGTSVGVAGSGFDPGSVIDLSIKRQGATTVLASTFVQADKGGTFTSASLDVPITLSSGNFVVDAKERNSHNTAQAVGTIAGGAPQVKLGMAVGKPGDVIVLSLHGFAPRETINVFWNTLSGQPVTTFQADGGGGVGQGKIQVPFGAVGDNTFLFVGATSQSLVAASFLVLQLYPTVKLGSYALKANNAMTFSGSGFGPSERVFVFLNSMNGSPLAVINADASGSFKNAPGFVVPFTISGKQTLIFMGEQSRAPDATTFTVLPYTPQVQASTYGGLPGMTISFYGTGFAGNEVVHVYAGHTKSTLGTMVSCFQTDDKGNAASQGSYLIPGNAQGTLGFALVGAKSGGVGVASLNISAPPQPVHTPPQAPFTCPLDQPTQQGQPGQGTPPAATAQPTAPAAPSDSKGTLVRPGQHQQIVMGRVVSVSGTTNHSGALLSLMAVPQLPAAEVAASQLHDGTLRVRFERPHRVWNVLGQVTITPLIYGLGLLWFVFVLVLNIAVMWRSTRQEATNREFTRRADAAPGRLPRDRLPRVRVTMRGAPNDAGQHTMMLPSAREHGSSASTRVQNCSQGIQIDARHQMGAATDAGVSLATYHHTGSILRAARCTVTRHSAGSQPGHDATFAQADLKMAGDGPRFGLFLVADGRAGGHPSAGIVASQITVDRIARRVIAAMSNGPGVPATLIRPLFKYAVMQASDALLAQNASQSTGMSTTVTGALVVGDSVYIVNVGNSRTYLLSWAGGFRQITRDHSVVFGMVSAGLVGATAIEASPHAQQLYRSLGDMDQPMRVDTFAISVLPGDQLLLCSDGLWRKVRDAHIEAVLRDTADPREATWQLTQAASENGPEDDISIIVVHILAAGLDAGSSAGPPPSA